MEAYFARSRHVKWTYSSKWQVQMLLKVHGSKISRLARQLAVILPLWLSSMLGLRELARSPLFFVSDFVFSCLVLLNVHGFLLQKFQVAFTCIAASEYRACIKGISFH
jgi:hypothetical protein